MHACDALELPGQQREHLDSFIDQLYKDVDKGQRFISAAQRRREQIIPVTAGLICMGRIVRASVFSLCAFVAPKPDARRFNCYVKQKKTGKKNKHSASLTKKKKKVGRVCLSLQRRETS